MISTTQFRPGAKIEISGEPYTIVEYQHVKPGKGGAFVRTKLKSLKSGSVVEHTFRAGESLEEPDMEEREMQFLYSQGTDFHFMDTAITSSFPLLRTSSGRVPIFSRKICL